ncbi:MAG: SpoIIE family protein phosphatase, partial [Pseudomonadota bacterium]
ECRIQLAYQTVSGVHAKVTTRAEHFYLEDLGSSNGTYVNDQSISEPARLKHNDCLRFGKIVMRFKHKLPLHVELTNDEIDMTLITSSKMGKPRFDAYETQPEAKLKAVLEIGSSLAGTVELETLLPKILDTLFIIFLSADHACILLKDDKNGEMVPRAVKSRGQTSSETLSLSRTIVNKVLQEKTGILSADASTDAQFDSSQTIVDLSIRSMMCVPMLARDGEPLGIINIDSRRKGIPFSNEDLDLLMAVAAQAALSYENTRLFNSHVEKQKQDSELSIARHIQRSMLPTKHPLVKGYDFFVTYDSAQAVGGDYYDSFKLSETKLALTLGDVAGKGVPGAMIMTWLSSCVQTTLRFVNQADRAIAAINEQMCSKIVQGRYVTLVLMVIDITTHEITVVNAGHISPLIRKVDRSTVRFGDELVGPPLGVVEDYPYRADSRVLQPGEMVVILTDGVFEAMSREAKPYGVNRVIDFIGSDHANVRGLGEGLLRDVRDHARGRPQHDDITIMAIGRLDNP